MTAAARPWYRLRIRTILAAGVLAVVAWSLYSFWSDYAERAARRARELMAPTVGANCRVVFRSDALGVERSGARAAQINILDFNNRSRNHLAGVFVRMNDQWLVLESQEAGGANIRRWIPVEQILVVEEVLP